MGWKEGLKNGLARRMATRLSTLHLCPSFANDDQENHSATRYPAPIVFLSISELYTDCMGKWMDAVVGKAESPSQT